jgi:oligoendopeptidase F
MILSLSYANNRRKLYMSETKILPPRSEIPIEETWNLKSIFPSVRDWETALKTVESKLSEITKYQGQLSKGPLTLLEYLKIAEDTNILALKVMVYSGLDQSTDVANQDAAARAGQGRGLMAKVSTAISFAEPELMSIGFEKLYQWADEVPELKIYHHYFSNLERQSLHVRSSEVEEILAMVLEPLPSNTPPAYSSLVNSELPFKPAIGMDGAEMEIGQSSINSLIDHIDRGIRRTAFENYADSYLQFKNTIAGIQIQTLQGDAFRARARRYNSSLQASLEPNNIPLEVFHNLIDVFKQNLPTWHKYWRIRRQALGYDSFGVHDIKAPLTQSKVNIPFDQAVEWICEGMAPLGEEYVDILRRGCTEERWVDRALNKGKRQGAFSWGSYGTQPFIMMSFANDIFSLSTLAHELGHSMHSYYTRKSQPFIYGRYSLFVAEVASNFNQAMVRDYLFKTQTDPAFQLALIEEAMSNFHRYFFIMPTLARWELEMHERIEKSAPINAKIMTDRCAELFAEGYGNDVEYDHDRIGITWAQFGHMYMNYYVYQYATGISGAHALVDKVLAEGPNAAEKYINFLKAGNSVYPLDALKTAGVDLTNPEPVEKAFKVLADIVNRLDDLAEQGVF